MKLQHLTRVQRKIVKVRKQYQAAQRREGVREEQKGNDKESASKSPEGNDEKPTVNKESQDMNQTKEFEPEIEAVRTKKGAVKLTPGKKTKKDKGKISTVSSARKGSDDISDKVKLTAEGEKSKSIAKRTRKKFHKSL